MQIKAAFAVLYRAAQLVNKKRSYTNDTNTMLSAFVNGRAATSKC